VANTKRLARAAIRSGNRIPNDGEHNLRTQHSPARTPRDEHRKFATMRLSLSMFDVASASSTRTTCTDSSTAPVPHQLRSEPLKPANPNQHWRPDINTQGIKIQTQISEFATAAHEIETKTPTRRKRSLVARRFARSPMGLGRCA
jgi:hypothetical protein